MVLLVICELSEKSGRLGKLLCGMTWLGQCRQKADSHESTCQGGGTWKTYRERLVWSGVGLEVRESNSAMCAGGDTTRRLGE